MVGKTNRRIIISSTFFFQELTRGLQELLSYEGNVEEDMCQSFQVLALVLYNYIFKLVNGNDKIILHPFRNCSGDWLMTRLQLHDGTV